MTLKAKWESLHFNSAKNCLWVFVAGKMYVINETACAKMQVKLSDRKSPENSIIFKKTRINEDF
ncbi:MAG: hypothetical protein IT280_05855 [Ignavibacteria bacterium]|nr:hypothetical protein [Ignavibacteria bacterium]